MKIKTQHTKTYRCSESIAKGGEKKTKQERSQNNNLTLQFKELKKKNKLNPKLAEKGNNKDKGFPDGSDGKESVC